MFSLMDYSWWFKLRSALFESGCYSKSGWHATSFISAWVSQYSCWSRALVCIVFVHFATWGQLPESVSTYMQLLNQSTSKFHKDTFRTPVNMFLNKTQHMTCGSPCVPQCYCRPVANTSPHVCVAWGLGLLCQPQSKSVLLDHNLLENNTYRKKEILSIKTAYFR